MPTSRMKPERYHGAVAICSSRSTIELGAPAPELSGRTLARSTAVRSGPCRAALAVASRETRSILTAAKEHGNVFRCATSPSRLSSRPCPSPRA
eukprot:scaffold6586_cov34-Tisochrysis_lutea.AAC.3